MIKFLHNIKNFWLNYSTGSKQLRPLARFAIALVVHAFRLPTCSWRRVDNKKVELVVFAMSKKRADEIMVYVEKLEDKTEQMKLVMR